MSRKMTSTRTMGYVVDSCKQDEMIEKEVRIMKCSKNNVVKNNGRCNLLQPLPRWRMNEAEVVKMTITY